MTSKGRKEGKKKDWVGRELGAGEQGKEVGREKTRGGGGGIGKKGEKIAL